MKTVYIITLVLIGLIILLLIKKNEHFLTGNEAVLNIAKIYADASGTTTFNNLKTNNIINSNKINTTDLDISGSIYSKNDLNIDISGYYISTNGNLNVANKLDISNNLNINTTLNVNSILNLAGVDIRYYLTGCTLLSQENSDYSKRANSGNLIHLPIGPFDFYSLGDQNFNKIANIAIVYPGFGVQLFYNIFENNNYVIIENYGTKPYRHHFAINGAWTSSDSVASFNNIKSTNDLYNTDTSTIKISTAGTFANDFVSSAYVYLLDINKWIQHKP